MNGTVVPGVFRTRTGRFACIAMMLLSATAIQAAAEEQTDLGGVYTSHGTNPDGSEYRGAVSILRRGDRFIVTWMSPRATGAAVLLELTSVGVGIRTGETLSVSYVAGNSLGVAVYQIDHDGRLSGRWTTVGDSELHVETLTKLPNNVPDEPAAEDLSDAPSPPLHRAPRPPAGTTSL